MYTNPITMREYEKEPEYVESLIQQYVQVKRHMIDTQEAEASLVKEFEKLAKKHAPEVTHGKVDLVGLTKQVEVEMRVNASYPREKGEEHPLKLLVKEFDKLGPMVRQEFEESGSKIQAMLDRYRANALNMTDDKELIERLLKVRVEKPGKPGIKIEDKMNVQEVEDGPGAVAAY